MAQTVDPKNGIQGSGWTPVQSEREICLPEGEISVAESLPAETNFSSAETVVAPDSGYTQPPSSLLCRPTPPAQSANQADQIFGEFEQARTDYLSGDADLVPSALLKLRDLKKQTAGSSDPTIALVHQEVRGILRHETLQTIAGLAGDNESLADQRLRRMELNLYDEQTRDANRDFLGYLRGFVEGGRADTLDEAIGFMRSEHRRLQGEFAKNSVVREGWIVPLAHKAPRFGSAEWTAERRNAGAFFQAFRANPNADDANVRTIRLDGGTVDLTHSRDLPEALRVVIGRQGGFIKAGDMTYTFRPRAQETTVAIQRNSILTPHLREGRDFQRDPHLGARGVGRVTEDYRGGHPQTFERFLGRAGHWTNIDLRDPDFHNLLKLHTRQGLEMRTPELRQRHLLHVAKELRHRNGSYETSARLLQTIFREPLQRAVFEVEPGEDESATLARAFEKMEAWHHSGRLRREDPVAAEAWAIFEDMKDPFNRTLNISDEGWDEIADFLVENAIIMIPTMGMGAGVQAVVKGSRAALFMARQGARLGGRVASGLGARAGQIGAQLGASGARMGTALAARGAFEGTLQAAGMTAFGHKFEWSQVGWNTLTQVMFHGVGAGVGAVGQRLGASRLATTAASQVALGLGDVGLSYLHNDGPDTFGERFVAGMAKMGYFSVLGRIATPPSTATVRTRSAVEGRARFQSMGEVQSRAERIASAVTEGRAARYRDHLVRNKGMTEADADAHVAEWRKRVVQKARESQARRTRIVDTNLPPRPETAHLDAATVDHHGRFANEKNATMQVLDHFEAALEAVRNDPEALAQARADRAIMREAGGDPVVAAAIRKLGIRQVTTDNLNDGAWSVWLARNQARVLRDPALRTLIRDATFFEDFTAFGTNYDRSSPGVELQAALFKRYNDILTRHQIRGSDRFTPQQAEAVMAEAMRAIDSLVTDPAAVWNRRAEAESFWRGVDEAVGALKRDAAMDGPTADGVIFYDLSRVSQYPTITQWLAVPIAHSLSLQVTVAPMPPATTASGATAPRSLMFVAIPNGRFLPTGKGLLSVVDRMNAAEAAKAQELGLQPNSWFGKNNVILPNPQNGGTLLTPTEISAILRAPENGLFHSEGGTRAYAERLGSIETDLLPLDFALSAERVDSLVRARDSGGQPDMDFQIRFKPPDAVQPHLDDGLTNVSPEEMVSVDVEVADWAAAERVANRLRGAEGVAVEHNNDLASPEAGFTGKDVSVRMESGLRVDVRVRVRSTQFPFLPPEAVHAMEPAAQRAFIDHLRGERGWGWQEVQDLLGPEQMRTLFGFGERIPFGFQSEAQFRTFSRSLMSELLAAGVPIYDPRVQVVIQGSAARGRSDGEATPFRWETQNGQKPSDIDVAVIVAPEIFGEFVGRRMRLESRSGNEGQAREPSGLKKLRRRVTGQGRMSSYDMDPSLREAHNRVRDSFHERRIQMSLLLPDSPFVPSVDDSIVISAEEFAVGPN